MCPFEPRRDAVEDAFRMQKYSRRDSLFSKDEAVIIRKAQEFGVSVDELCRLMQLRGISVRQHINDQYGDLEGLAMQMLTSPTKGLDESPHDLDKRQQKFGKNVIPMKEPKSFLHLMLHTLKEPTLIILEVAAVVSLALAVWNIVRPDAEKDAQSYEWIEGVAIVVGVMVIVLVSATNDYGKEQQFRVLQAKVREEHKVTVIRKGQIILIPVQELLVGDICQVKYGDLIPADGVVLQGQELRLDESSQTGESDPVKKDSDTDCQVLSGTHVIEGSGRILILAVGVNSQSGSIYKLLGAVQEKSKSKKQAPSGITVPDSESNSTDGSLDGTPGESSSAKKSVDEQRKQTNHSVFQSKLNILAYKIGILGLVFSAGTSIVIIIRFCVENYAVQKNGWKTHDATTILDSIIVGITILVAAIPEGLPLAVTLTLAFSAKKMMQDNNLVRHLYACETMGCATTICSDKTGTLTTNRMTVTESWIGGQIHHPIPSPSSVSQKILELISSAVAINSNYTSEVVANKEGGPPEQRGNKTECALLSFASSLGVDCHQIRQAHPEASFLKVFTFNSTRKSMSTVVEIPGGWRVYVKGAAEIVLSKCSFILTQSGSPVPLSPETSQSIADTVISPMASNALRSICIAYKDYLLDSAQNSIPSNAQACRSRPDFNDENAIVSDLTCLCIVGIEDPVRPEVPRAIRRCQRAGVTVRMVSGDNVQTARSIALKCGIIRPGDGSLVLEGKEFNQMIRDSNGQVDSVRFNNVWPQLRVLARSTPEDKFTLVDGIINSKISKHREVVAVTGDGTNDAPALRKADVGFAMGIAGTDVAKEASDIIITDDNFISIVKACMWGRNIYDNVAKFLQFQLTVNVAALSVAIVAACVIGDTPLKAVPMLWINMIQDTLGSLALATEPPGEALLQRKPYGRKKRIISRMMARNILGQGLYQAGVLLLILFYGPRYFEIYEDREIGHVVGEPSFIYTMIFNTLVMMTSFNLINARWIHNEVNVFAGIHRNLYFVILWAVMVATQAIVVQFGGYAFATQPLEADAWMICLFFGFGSLLCYQLLRFVPVQWKQTKNSRLF
ncbi:plasma membrane calcium-transporting ATPase 2-like [Paramacrobiotus metropolitanus]|uniref:plasma membrane calcium-transporting ATPase 2-like n=1 Tax=Paramacrobiotus metropolitanus TaxID=2943436 RepID=UPI0024460FC6|nr:plasma membrane calcium-transporting ATPase 2-like [Paramacrobiotus metropolitanus]